MGTTLTANDITGTSTGIQIGSGMIRDNYIHDLAMVSGDHVNGMTSNGSSQRLVIEADRLITGNLLAGGGYTIYGGTGGSAPPMTSGSSATGGSYGPIAHFDSQGPANLWTGNVWDEDGSPIA